jgi:DNA-binding response OmpR family regulator
VVARAGAVLRRSLRNQDELSQKIVLGDLRIDLDARLAFLKGVAVKLTPTEFRILVVLARRPGRLFARTELTDAVLSDDALERGIDAHVSRLRAKLGGYTQAKINASRGEGYRLDLQ